MSEAADFFVKTYDSKIDLIREDRMQWVHDNKSGFSVNSYSKGLNRHENNTYPWKCIWKARVPSKVAFFCWLVSLKKVLTTENLRKMGLYVMDWCFMCKKKWQIC